MGRPWWYDSYWQRDNKPTRGSRRGRQFWVWMAVVVLSLLLTASSARYYGFSIAPSLYLFVQYFCRILAFVIFIRVLLSWFIVGRYNPAIIVLDDLTEPILSPLRRTIPRLGIFDITPMVAIGILYFIPAIFGRLLL